MSAGLALLARDVSVALCALAWLSGGAAPAKAAEPPATPRAFVTPAGQPASPAPSPPQPPRETVVVVGSAPGIETSPASAATEVPRLHVERRSPEHLAQLLETVPGVAVVSEGHAAVPAVRGLARGRTLLLIDGARVSAERRVGPAATFLDPLVVEAVDVARGPGAVAYGTDALGGVIAVRTRRAAPGTPWTGRATLQAGLGVPLRRAGLSAGGGLGPGGLFVSVHGRDADDYLGPDGRRVGNSSWRDGGALLSYAQPLAGGRLAGILQGDVARDVERPRSNSAAVRFVVPFERSQRLTASWERAAGDGSGLRLTAFHGWSSQRTDQEALTAAGAVRSVERADVRARDLHVRGSAHRALGTAVLEGGVDVHGRYGLHATDGTLQFVTSAPSATTVVSVDRASRLAAGLFARLSAPLAARVSVAGGLRADDVRTRNRGGVFGARATRDAVLTGFAATTVRLTDTLASTLQLSRGFRDPTLSDRYFRGPTGRGSITGNPDLEPERSLQIDLAVRRTLSFGQLAVYAYDYRITDLVERYAQDADQFFFRNRGRARLRGLEVESTVFGPRGLSFEFGASVARGHADAGDPLDDVAPTSVTALARQDLAGRGFAQVRLTTAARDRRPGPSEVEAPGGTLLDVGGGWRVHPLVDVRALVRNALDTAQYASPDPRWVYAPGRSFSVTLVVGR